MRMFLKFIKETFLVLLLVGIACIYPIAVHFVVKFLGANVAVMVIGVIVVFIMGVKLSNKLIGKFEHILAGGVPRVLYWLVKYIMIIHAVCNVLTAYNYLKLLGRI